MRILGLAATVLFLTSVSNSAVAQSFAENVARLDGSARTWANSFANPNAFSGEWQPGGGLVHYRLGSTFRYQNGQLRTILYNRLAFENPQFVRTTENRSGLVHEYTVTCYPEYGDTNRSFSSTLRVLVQIAPIFNEYPANPGDLTGLVQISGCRNIKQFGPVFRARP
jgi:hypothetical protein